VTTVPPPPPSSSSAETKPSETGTPLK
jgi:hypothetical protein